MSVRKNDNICIIGESGAGKTLFLEDKVLAKLAMGEKAFVFDYHGKFLHLSKLVGGTAVEINPNKPISVNPFPNVPTGSDNTSVSIRDDFLDSFLLTLCAMVSPDKELIQEHQYLLKKSLKETWKTKQNNTTIDDIASFLQKYNNKIANDLAQMLSGYIKGGKYADFFCGESNINLNSNIVAIDIWDAREDDHRGVMAVVTQALLANIKIIIAKSEFEKNINNLLIFDEISKCINNRYTLHFIKNFAGESGRYRTSTVLVAHAIFDFKDLGEDAESIFKESEFKIIMGHHKRHLLREYEKIPDLTEYLALGCEPINEKILSLKSGSGSKYSEFTVMGGDDFCNATYQLRLSPLTMLFIDSDSTERDMIYGCRSRGMSLLNALRYTLTKLNISKESNIEFIESNNALHYLLSRFYQEQQTKEDK